MDFLDKLYASDYFGIGLFAVISFLVVAFLVVLFFGKKDEQKRKLEETLKLDVENANQNAFKETGIKVPVEVSPVIPTPVSPIIGNTQPINNNVVNLQSGTFNSIPSENRVIEEPVKPIFEPIKNEIPIIAREEEPIIKEEVVPGVKVLEPVKVDTIINPVFKEEVTPIVTPPQPTVNMYHGTQETQNPPISYDSVRVDSPVINPVNTVPSEPRNETINPTVDFDAIARSISKELDELENTTKYKEDVKITPINDVVTPRPVNQFSSVYVNEQPKPVSPAPIDLPQKIDLPTRKAEDIEPESYSI